MSETTNAALSSRSSQRSPLDTLSTSTTSLATALSTFGNSMNSVKIRLAQVVADAAAAELVVSGSTIHSPDDPSDEKYETKKAKFDELKETLYLIRRDELQVPSAAAQCGGLHGGGGRPRQDGDLAHAVGQDEGLELGEQALHPWHDRLEGAAGRVQGHEGAHWRRCVQGFEGAQGGRRCDDGPLRGIGRLGAVQEGFGQPQHGGGEKIARAGTQAVAQGVGGYAGGWAGAQVGMMIGAAGGPIGIAAGGIIGGAIGGIAGSKFGESVGNAINKGWHKLFG